MLYVYSHHSWSHIARLTMKPLTYATKKSFMSQLSIYSCCTCSATCIWTAPSVPIPWFVDGCGKGTSVSSKNECRLSTSSDLSSLQFVLVRPLEARSLIIIVLRAFTSCPTVGLLFEPQCKWITPNVFSRESWLTHCGRVTQICVFSTVNLGTSASSP